MPPTAPGRGGSLCPACGGGRVMPATGRPCLHCRGTGLGGGARAPGVAGTSGNRYPQSRSASMPIMPAGSGYLVQPAPAPLSPRMPSPAPAGPYEQENAKGQEAMVQTYNNAVSVPNVSTQLLQRNTARKAMMFANPSQTLTVFLDFLMGPATIRSFPLFPLSTREFWSGYKEFIPKDEVWAIASAAGPVLVGVTEFS